MGGQIRAVPIFMYCYYQRLGYIFSSTEVVTTKRGRMVDQHELTLSLR